ncbi:MAG TPA: RDD family protein [Bdellovibrionota bacterium]|nr:RDD family protein [Bdellovibrionota bacterium]
MESSFENSLQGSPPTQRPLIFRPMTEGLGFHPFSDGLPYAPISKSVGRSTRSSSPSRATGAGAVAAGPAIPIPSVSRVSVPVARVTPNSVAHSNAISRAVAPPLPQVERPQNGFGYVLKRILAYSVDTGFNLLVGGAALSWVLWNESLSPDALLGPGIILLALLFLAFFSWALITAQEIAFGTSIGKRLFGLHLPGSASTLLLRAILFVPSLTFAGLGLCWALFGRQKRCWHDIVVGVQPMKGSQWET